MENKSEKVSPKITALPGAVVAHRVRCGRSNCRCAHGNLHGPYFYRYWREGRTRRKAYVRKNAVPAVQAACNAYRNKQREYRELVQESHAEWRRLKALLKELGL